MPPRVTYLPTDLYRQVKETALRNTADEAVADLGWGSVLDSALTGLRDTYRRATAPASPGPGPEMPIVVSERPEVRGIDLPDYGRAAEGTPTFHVDDFSTGEDGETLYTPGAGLSRAAGGSAGGAVGASAAPSGPSSYASGSWDRKAYDAAVRAGHPDPVEFVEQMRQESGFAPDVISGQRSSPAGAQGIAQIMPATARAWGVDPLDPDAALGAAARAMTGYYRDYDGDSERALAAYNAGPGNVATYNGVPPFAETQKYIQIIRSRTAQQATQAAPSTQASAPAYGTYTPETLTPNQFTEGREQGLTPEEAVAVCGPAAAVAFSRANGRTPTLREAKELAQSLNLWDPSVGMHGPTSELQLLQRMGVPADLAEGADWEHVAQEVGAGRPVILDSPQHYFVATGYDPQTGEFELGQSAGVLRKSGGKTRWRPEQIPSLGMGDIRSTIFMGRGM